MLERYRPLAAVVAALAACSVALWVLLEPRGPNLARYEESGKKQADYHPGDSDCHPSRLARLRLPTREAEDQRERCAEAAEEYRLKTNDLVQQTRSADAAEAVVALTYDQSQIALASLILGVLTLVAASAAALYASQAASETKRSADAAERAVEAAARANQINREAYMADQRPWLSVSYAPHSGLEWTDSHCFFDIAFSLKNSGRTPALKAFVEIRLMPDSNLAMFPKRQRDLSDEVLAGRSYRPAITVFPESEERYVLGIQSASSKIPVRRNGPQGEAESLDAVQLRIVGCVQYSSSEEGPLHQTGFMFTVFRKENGRFDLSLLPSMGDIPKECLLLERWGYPARVF